MPSSDSLDRGENPDRSIFQSMKFWLSLKVPMRNNIKAAIENNGGIIVHLEKDADILIADHARKDSPVGSVSWKFITESVEHGMLQIEDKYTIQWDPRSEKNRVANNTQKRTRAAFTPSEDAALVAWVLKTGARAGNQAYMEFAEKYPSDHTWASWRNRFVKRFSHLDQKQLAQIAAEYQFSNSENADSNTASTAAMTESQRDSQSGNTRYHGPKQQFYEDLDMYIDATGAKIEKDCMFSGKHFELWDLAKAINSQKVPAEELDWDKVAEELGYNWVANKDISKTLQLCYEENLMDFLDSLDEFSPSDTAEENEGATSSKSKSVAPPTSPRSYVPSSPPSRFLSGKRALDSEPEIPLGGKRQKLNKNAEIPSTPESALKAAGQSNHRTPTLQGRQSTMDFTPSQQLQDEWSNATPIPLRLDDVNTRQPTPREDDERPVAKKAPRRSLPAEFKSRSPPRQAQISEPVNGDEDIAHWIGFYESLGYSHDIVIKALVATSMRTGGAAAQTMESLKQKQGLPTHMEGVWTQRDDNSLRLILSTDISKTPLDASAKRRVANSKREALRLENKHGKESMELRSQFLDALEASQQA